MHRSAAQLMLIVAVIGLVLMRESREEPLSHIEESFTNWLAANTTRTVAPAPLALVEINDNSFGNQHPWPWSPLDYALFLDDVLQFKPRVLAIEPVLAWRTQQLNADAQLKYPQFEKILHDRVLVSPKLVLGAQLGFPEDSDLVPPLQPVPVLRKVSGSVREIPPFTSIEQQPREELRLATTPGFANVPGDQAPVRKAPLLFLYQGQVVPSFVLQSLMLWLGVTPDDVHVELGREIMLGDVRRVPVDAGGAMLVDFKSPFTRLGFEELLLAVEQTQAKTAPVIAPEAIAGKLALLARTDASARTLDLPIGRKGSPGELFAAAIATVQNQTFIHRIGIWFDAMVIAAMMAMSWYLYKQSRRIAIVAMATLLALYLMLGLAIFSSFQLALPLALPSGLAVFIVLFRLFAPKRGLLPAAA